MGADGRARAEDRIRCHASDPAECRIAPQPARGGVTLNGEVASADAAKERSDSHFAERASYAVAAFLSLLGVIRYGAHLETIVVVVVICTLVVISRHDLERHVIPNRIVVPAWIGVLLAQVAIHPHRWAEWLVASLGAGAFFLVVQLAYPAGLGMGDVKLACLL